MSTSTTLPRAYRSALRQLHKSSIVPRPQRNQAIFIHLRDIVESQRQTIKTDPEHVYRQLNELAAFLEHSRKYDELLNRYNPLHDMTPGERINATARRVGWDKPKEYDPEEAAREALEEAMQGVKKD